MSGVHTDPRTKIFVLLICAVAITISPSLYYEGGLVLLIFIYGIASGKPKYSVITALVYGVLIGIAVLSNLYLTGALRLMFTTFSDFIGKMFPCGMMGGLLIGTTQVSEFMAALNRMHIPKSVVIPVTVMIRYIPMIQEDWGLYQRLHENAGCCPFFLWCYHTSEPNCRMCLCSPNDGCF